MEYASKDESFDPWMTAVQRYAPGQFVEGVVTRVVSFGLFVRLEEGIEGFVPRLMVSGEDITPEELNLRVHADARVAVRIRSIDARRRRLALTMCDVPQLTATYEAHCLSCQRAIWPGWRHCAYCGVSLTRVCPQCGAPRVDIDGARFCFACGSSFV